MPKPKMIMALAKVIIAAAWADGQMTNQELNSLKDLLFRIPEMTSRDWAELEIYMHSPVSPQDRARLVENLKAALSTPRDKALAISKLEEMVSADDVVIPEERAVVDQIKESIEDVDVGLLGRLGHLVRGPVHRRAKSIQEGRNREIFLDDFIKNRIFYDVRRRMASAHIGFEIPEPELRLLSLAGGLMTRVAYVDREVSGEEFDAMLKALQRGWDIPPESAALVARVAVDEISQDLDLYRLARQFFEVTTEDQRVQFLDVLFAVAESDGQVSYQETEEIRKISNLLKLTHRQFINAKLKIPRSNRAT